MSAKTKVKRPEKAKSIYNRLADYVEGYGEASPAWAAKQKVGELQRELTMAQMVLAFEERKMAAVRDAATYEELDRAMAMQVHDEGVRMIAADLADGGRSWSELAKSGADDSRIRANIQNVKRKNAWDCKVRRGSYELDPSMVCLFLIPSKESYVSSQDRVEVLRGNDLVAAARRAFNIPKPKKAEPTAPAKAEVDKTGKPAKKKPTKKAAAKTAEVEKIAEKQQADPPAPATPALQELGNDELAMLNSANEAGVLERIAPPNIRRQLQRKGLIEAAREGSGERKRYYCLSEAGWEAVAGWKPVLTPVAVNESKQEPARSYPPKAAQPAKQQDDADQERPEDVHIDQERELVLGPFVYCNRNAELNEGIEYVLREAGFADRPIETVVHAFSANGITTLSQIRDLVDTEKTDAREYWRPAFARVCIEYGLEPLWESIERAIKKYLKNLYSA